MGKGKGALNRYCTRISQNHNLFEFSGFSLNELSRLKKIFQKKVKIPVKINSNFFINKNYLYKANNENFCFFKKYKN